MLTGQGQSPPFWEDDFWHRVITDYEEAFGRWEETKHWPFLAGLSIDLGCWTYRGEIYELVPPDNYKKKACVSVL